MKIGFDNEKYLAEQSEEIRRRAAKYGKLYLEFGGKLINDDLHIAAPFTEEILARYYVDRAFISCGGISPNGDITDYSDIALKRSVVREHANKMILVADSGKFGKRAFVKVCDLKMLDSVITDTNLSPEYRDMLTERGLNVVFAEIRNRS